MCLPAICTRRRLDDARLAVTPRRENARQEWIPLKRSCRPPRRARTPNRMERISIDLGRRSFSLSFLSVRPSALTVLHRRDFAASSFHFSYPPARGFCVRVSRPSPPRLSICL